MRTLHATTKTVSNNMKHLIFWFQTLIHHLHQNTIVTIQQASMGWGSAGLQMPIHIHIFCGRFWPEK